MTTYEPPGGLPWGLYGLCAGSLLLNAIFVTNWMMSPASPAAVEHTPAELHAAAVQAPEPAEAAAVDAPAEPVEGAAVDAVEPEIPVQDEPEATPVPEGMHKASLTVHHSLARTFQDGVGDEGDVLSANVARLFVWDLDLRRDLQAGDKIDVVWTGSGETLVVEAARYESNKLGTFEAYRLQAPGDEWPSWWTPEGIEVSRTLNDSPIHGYEQITSLLKDRPRHRGMDFKAPEGTPIVLPKSATITRTDWNVRNNGNCVEARFSDGTTAKFLHLSRTDAKAGQKLAAGATVGLTGNTGRSTAPHLHYELEKNGQVVDPVDYHGVTRRKLPAGARDALDAQIGRYASVFGG